MTELLVKVSETKFPERYIYKKRDWTEKEYESGLNLSYNVYNKNMKRNIIFHSNGYSFFIPSPEALPIKELPEFTGFSSI